MLETLNQMNFLRFAHSESLHELQIRTVCDLNIESRHTNSVKFTEIQRSFFIYYLHKKWDQKLILSAAFIKDKIIFDPKV